MHDDVHDPGLLATDAAPGEGPGIDPMRAVLAVAEPRERVSRPQPNEAGDAGGENPGPGLLVETRVRTVPENGAAAGEAPPVEDAYGDFAWPDGYVADPGAVAKFVPIARKMGLSKEAAQELAGLYAELDQERGRKQAEFVARNNAEWLREIQSHPEFGGARLSRTGEEVAAMLRRHGSPLLTAQIRQMNVQNWPEMFYFLARVAKAMGEDCSPVGGPGLLPPKSTAQLLFPGLK